VHGTKCLHELSRFDPFGIGDLKVGLTDPEWLIPPVTGLIHERIPFGFCKESGY
jgi:hypothetical protein